MSNITAVLPLDVPVASTFWYSADVASATGSNDIFTFGKEIGSRVYLVRIVKATAPTLLSCFATPGYSGNKTIPPKKPQTIPLNTGNGSEPTIAILNLDTTQAFQMSVDGLDVGGAYTMLVATNYMDDLNC